MKKSFTLVELLIVLVIIGVITAIAVPQYQKMVKRIAAAEAQRVLDPLSRAQYEYFVESGKFYHGGPSHADFSGLGVKPPTSSKYWCYYTVRNWDTSFGGEGVGVNSYGVVWAAIPTPLDNVPDGTIFSYIIAYVDGNPVDGTNGATPSGSVTKTYYHWRKGEPNWVEGWPE